MEEDKIKKLEIEFEKTKKELGFKATFDELEQIFYLRDMIFQNNLISTRLSRQICSRIVDAYSSWLSRLNLYVNKNSNYYVYYQESKFLDEDKQKIYELIHKIIIFISQNVIIALEKNISEEAKFIDDSLRLWNEIVPDLLYLCKKINTSWINEKPFDCSNDSCKNEYFG